MPVGVPSRGWGCQRKNLLPRCSGCSGIKAPRMAVEGASRNLQRRQTALPEGPAGLKRIANTDEAGPAGRAPEAAFRTCAFHFGTPPPPEAPPRPPGRERPPARGAGPAGGAGRCGCVARGLTYAAASVPPTRLAALLNTLRLPANTCGEAHPVRQQQGVQGAWARVESAAWDDVSRAAAVAGSIARRRTYSARHDRVKPVCFKNIRAS